MSFKGSIKELSLIDVIQLICQSAKSGIMKIHTDSFNVDIYIKDGKLVDIKSQNPDFSFKIGNYLVSRGIITQADLDIYLENQKKKPIRLGQLLVEEGVISKDEIKALYAENIKDSFTKVLSLESGQYEFIQSVVEYNPDDTILINIDTILLDTLKNIDEMKLFKKKISDFTLTYSKSNVNKNVIIDKSKATEDLPVISNKDSIILNDVSYLVYSMIDGINSIKQIIHKTALKEHVVLKVLFLLSENNDIKVVEAKSEKSGSKNSFRWYALTGVAFVVFALLFFLLLEEFSFLIIDFKERKLYSDYEMQLIESCNNELIFMKEVLNSDSEIMLKCK